MSKVKDISGMKFGRLTVLGRCGSTAQGTATWECICSCGRICIVDGAKLRKGNTRSCGCLHDDTAKRIHKTHGLSGTRLYAVWKSMIQRCHNPRNKNFSRYGARGIAVCDEWRKSYKSFYEWAISNGYDAKAAIMTCTIDRIDNDKGYFPENCRWVDMKTQRHNQSSNREEKRND